MRSTIYASFCLRRDANMNTLDALSSFGHHCRSVVELSEAPCFEREYTSITDGIADGLGACQWQNIMKTSVDLAHTSRTKKDGRVVVLLDTTPNQRASAKTLADCHMTHYPNPAPGNKPVCVGHEYATLAMLPEDAASRNKHWLLPLDVQRVPSNKKGHEVGMHQVRQLIAQGELNDELVLSVADSKYGTESCRKMVSKYKNWVHLFRIVSTRNIYDRVESKPTGQVGNRQRYGQKMTLNDEATHNEPNEKYSQAMTLSRGKQVRVEINVWRNKVFRGSRHFKGYAHPITLCQVTVSDQQGKRIWKKPMWLGLTGKRRGELTAEDIFDYYRSRYDIEHFFRFGKDKLLLDAYQTPDVDHEESWWKLSSLAYTQLYFARDTVPLLPKKWERYLPSYKISDTQEKIIAAPSQTQRAFSTVLDHVGTPALPCVARGKPKGRQRGENQTKRAKQTIVFKSEKKKKSDKEKINSGSEKNTKKSNPKKIETLVKKVKSQLEKADVGTDIFYQMLLAAT